MSSSSINRHMFSTCHFSDDVFKSTVHRAVNRSGVERYSIPLFFGTDYDVKLEVSSVHAYLKALIDVPARRCPAASPTNVLPSMRSSLRENM